MLNSSEHEISSLIKTKVLTIVYSFIYIALKLSDVVLHLLINVKMPTIVDVLSFMDRINLMLNSKKFNNLEAWYHKHIHKRVYR